MKIAIAGGTGTVGHHVNALALAAGHQTRVLARSQGTNLVTGVGLNLSGIDVVIDVSGVATMKTEAARHFFTAVTHNLLAAEKSCGVKHHVALSIVGTDRAPYGYYAGKLAQEEALASGNVAWTLLRATQFHEFAATIFERTRWRRIGLIPMMRTQPVAAHEVAARLLELATQPACGRALDLAGPREELLSDMTRRWATATGQGVVVSIPLPGNLGRAMRNGSLLPATDAQYGTQTFSDWLTAL